jgi:hypothetical protein
MNKIIEFLQNQSESENEMFSLEIDKQKLSKTFIDLSNRISTTESEYKRTIKLKPKLSIMVPFFRTTKLKI